jgi:hypothetical protein
MKMLTLLVRLYTTTAAAGPANNLEIDQMNVDRVSLYK